MTYLKLRKVILRASKIIFDFIFYLYLAQFHLEFCSRTEVTCSDFQCRVHLKKEREIKALYGCRICQQTFLFFLQCSVHQPSAQQKCVLFHGTIFHVSVLQNKFCQHFILFAKALRAQL